MRTRNILTLDQTDNRLHTSLTTFPLFCFVQWPDARNYRESARVTFNKQVTTNSKLNMDFELIQIFKQSSISEPANHDTDEITYRNIFQSSSCYSFEIKFIASTYRLIKSEYYH